MSEYFAMGGYAAFIWPAYVVVVAGLIGLYVASARALRAREAEIEIAEKSSPRRGER